MKYFEKEDVIHLSIRAGSEFDSIELEPNITAELDADGNVIGVEILNASEYIRQGLLASIRSHFPDSNTLSLKQHRGTP